MKKRKIIYGLFIIVMCVAVGYIAVYFWGKDDNNQRKNSENALDSRYEIDTVSKVYYGTLISSYSNEGKVCDDETEYIEIYSTEFEKNDKLIINVEVGDEVKAGDVLFSLNGINVISEYEGIITDIKRSSSFIEVYILNYDKQYIDMQISYELFQMINYDSYVRVSIDNKNIEGKIYRLGYKVENDMVNVKISFDGYIMPGRTADVTINLGETKSMMFVPKDMVMSVGEINYCNVIVDLEENITEQRSVEIGETYEVIEGDNKFYYIEIISGLSSDEQIAILKETITE